MELAFLFPVRFTGPTIPLDERLLRPELAFLLCDGIS
jgi:hypothetical protein